MVEADRVDAGRPLAAMHVSEQEAAAALDPGNVDQFLTGEALDARIEQIRKFLMEKLSPPGDQVER